MDPRNADRLRWAIYGAIALALYYRLRARIDVAVLVRELAAGLDPR